MSRTARQWLKEIRSLQLPDRVKIMNVCGGHERSITLAGLRGALPSSIELIPGPGCPVCICPEEDMLRVPVNVAKKDVRSLEQARAAGADIRPIASPLEAVSIARQQPHKKTVFFAAGFETTTAPVAAMVVEGVADNLLLLLSGRLTWPAVAMLLDSATPGFDTLIAPGHVATVMGSREWDFVPGKHGIPSAIAGFSPESLLAAIYSTLRQLIEGQAFLDNCYPELVRREGNPSARRQLQQAMEVVDANWRGVGVIPASGFNLRGAYEALDARRLFPDYADEARKRAGEMPPGCDCARVVLGQCYPDECRLYGTGCTPRHPIGPCMVSDEGACRIWWAGGVRENKHSGRTQGRVATRA
jgi:hydrogenase expression/formation protein HypD